MFEKTVQFIQEAYDTKEFLPLHEPVFFGNEKKYLNECIDSTFVSSVGKFVDQFEQMVAEYTGAKYAVATVNGTAALHIALKLVGTDENSEVITQPLTFIATCNAISYCNAIPVFVDVDRDTMGLSPKSLKTFLAQETTQKAGACYNKITGRKITAVVPMHTFGHPCKIDEIATICDEYNIALVEDAAESLGSYYKGKHTGTFGKISAFSFNGNKTITTGGGGMIITDDEALAKHAKHLTTTAKVPHPYEYIHDEIGYNYRLPNLNAALGCAQMETLDVILKKKRELASRYIDFFADKNIDFVTESQDAKVNYWLNAIILKDNAERDLFLKETNDSGVMTRPVWALMNRLEMFKNSQCTDLSNALWLEERVVNIPSGVRL
ncbi:MAG: Bacillosamine/Legionaminic acid biosynthesis aminotransferase PglE; 4-keto-6-deoxy-N-Acetyl-D-hexosaminyl-(Lipid carrier) aminotransferase [uncultured Sulfurovum sp.]|uniref:GDP-perosamine synthase n=1 Tax=uncultured Sulfurovum sp. TaxID=269237 RepID=A0A6S6UDP4_9BACT|nr:MAG: Bacillosamine/Legionaminic acid biosynthesis aminotransferase PglE; 4-keto-6-deoxy-N-Acetyl-D-hexosaminyl-(Lipid carrier) aminotransferase [uncultured Sulfurovum sp.]